MAEVERGEDQGQDGVEEQTYRADHEVGVVDLTYTIIEPLTVVIEFIAAPVTRPAVLRMILDHHHADVTVVVQLAVEVLDAV